MVIIQILFNDLIRVAETFLRNMGTILAVTTDERRQRKLKELLTALTVE